MLLAFYVKAKDTDVLSKSGKCICKVHSKKKEVQVNKRKTVLVIYTGGTIGMKTNEDNGILFILCIAFCLCKFVFMVSSQKPLVNCNFL